MATLSTSGCIEFIAFDGAPDIPLDPADIRPITPKYEPLSPGGNMASYEVFGERYTLMESRENYQEEGIASWYGTRFHGNKTSNGEIYDMYRLSAAHKTLPIPTYLKVTNLDNGLSTIVRVNDRGPFHQERVIDLSYAAAIKLGFASKGTTRVKLESIVPPSPEQLKAEQAKKTQAAKLEHDRRARLARLERERIAREKQKKMAVAIIDNTPTLENAQPIEWQPTPQQLADIQSDEMKQYIQVGAFADRNNAEKLLQTLLGENMPSPELIEHTINSNRVFRVRIGPVNDEDKAQLLLQQLASLGHTNSRLISE